MRRVLQELTYGVGQTALAPILAPLEPTLPSAHPGASHPASIEPPTNLVTRFLRQTSMRRRRRCSMRKGPREKAPSQTEPMLPALATPRNLRANPARLGGPSPPAAGTK